MVITDKVYLPTYEELEAPELPFGGHVLKAAGPHLGKYCEEKNDEFMMCRSELGPRYCVKEGKEVSKCTFDFFVKLKKLCYHELDAYSTCIDKSTWDLGVSLCRKTQAAFDKCVLDTLNIQRPDWAYYARPRIYKGKRPAPAPEPPQIFDEVPVMPDINDPNFPKENPPIFHSRFFWYS